MSSEGLPPDGGADTDRELIELCAAHIKALNDYALSPDEVPNFLDGPDAVESRLDGLRATTLAGVVAKAKVAMHRARLPDGLDDFGTDVVLDWPEQVVKDLLRLHGESGT